jgi:hypothetical protein
VIVAGFPFVKLPPNVRTKESFHKRESLCSRSSRQSEAESKSDRPEEIHAHNCLKMAFDMLAVVRRVKTVEGGSIEMRIG